MFTAGDTIIYENHGVCRITATRQMKCGHETRPYYVLNPLFENSTTTIYVPMGNSKCKHKMRRIISAEEVYSLIRAMPDEPTVWIENDNERKAAYKQILAGDDRSALMKMIKTLHLYQQDAKGKGRKLHTADERMMKDAENALYEEFAHVLDIRREEVLPFIQEQIAMQTAQDSEAFDPAASAGD